MIIVNCNFLLSAQIFGHRLLRRTLQRSARWRAIKLRKKAMLILAGKGM
jgi:hypothetical protein